MDKTHEKQALQETANIERPIFYLETYGCQMNEYDSELVRSILLGSGYCETVDPEAADVILLNTCSVRENAHNRVYGRLQMLNDLRSCGNPLHFVGNEPSKQLFSVSWIANDVVIKEGNKSGVTK